LIFVLISSINGGKISLSGEFRVISVTITHTVLSFSRISDKRLELIGWVRA